MLDSVLGPPVVGWLSWSVGLSTPSIWFRKQVLLLYSIPATSTCTLLFVNIVDKHHHLKNFEESYFILDTYLETLLLTILLSRHLDLVIDPSAV